MLRQLLPAGDGGALPNNQVLRRACVVLGATAAAGTAITAWRAAARRRRFRAGSADEGLPSIPWTEVAQHTQLGNVWLVLHGEVLDVTPFLEEHPGGKLLLLAFAGRDATEPFETVGHSAIARRELRRLRIGRLQAWSESGGAVLAVSPSRKATLTGGRRAAVPSAQAPREDAPLWEVGEHGFLPSRDPVGLEALHGTAFEAFADLADLLPALGLRGALRTLLDEDPELQARLRCCGEPEVIDGLSEDQIERAFAVVGYTMLAYWRGGTLPYSTGLVGSCGAAPQEGSCAVGSTEAPTQLPEFLAAPMLALSKKLGRPPMTDYASTVLYNWVRIDPNGPISPSNIRCVLRLTGLLDEEWFFKTHVVIESEAAHAVSALLGASRAQTDAELLENLMALEEALWRVVRACLPIMYERGEDGTPKCSEHIFYHVLRPLIKSDTLIFEGEGPPGRRLVGPSGAMSSLLPAIDAVLGIQTTSERLREALGYFEKSMPVPHQEFLAELRGRRSVRHHILFGRPVAGEGTDRHDALVRSFNRCIARVLDFRWQHWQYVKNFIMKPGNISHAVGSGGTSFDYLQQHITDTEHARLTERSEGFSMIATPGTPTWPSVRLPPVTYHPTLEFWSVDGKRGLLAREPLTGPEAAWSKGLPEAMIKSFKVLWDLAERMPALCVADGPFVALCEAAAERLRPLEDERLLLDVPEAGRENLMTTLCHIAAGCVGVGVGVPGNQKRLPRCIDRLLKAIARSVGRPPRLDVAELVLCNWAVTHTPSPGEVPRLSSQAQVSELSYSDDSQRPLPQLHVAWRFLASPDEEWYRAVHILLHNEARDVVAAIRVGQVAMRDQNDLGVVGSLVKLSLCFNRFCDYFDAHFEQKDSRTEPVMIRRLEPFIAHSSDHDLSWEETACWVYCSGSSVLLPAVHAFLGVKMGACTAGEASEGDRLAQLLRKLLKGLRHHMPKLHLAFLEELEKPGVSLRRYCFRRFSAKSVSVALLHDLEVAYNDALNSLVRFLSRRMHLVSRFFPQLASTFGTLHSDIEASMRRNRLQLLKMRQRVDRCLEK